MKTDMPTRSLSLAVRAWLRLMRVFGKVERSLVDGLRCEGLSLAQFDVLARVGANEGITQQELADSLLVTKGNVCQLLDRLETSGLLRRRQEGRANHLYLTPEGHELRNRILPPHEAQIDRLLSPLDAEEQAELLRLLRKLDRALDEPAGR